jgi:hypothetical protein
MLLLKKPTKLRLKGVLYDFFTGYYKCHITLYLNNHRSVICHWLQEFAFSVKGTPYKVGNSPAAHGCGAGGMLCKGLATKCQLSFKNAAAGREALAVTTFMVAHLHSNQIHLSQISGKILLVFHIGIALVIEHLLNIHAQNLYIKNSKFVCI